MIQEYYALSPFVFRQFLWKTVRSQLFRIVLDHPDNRQLYLEQFLLFLIL